MKEEHIGPGYNNTLYWNAVILTLLKIYDKIYRYISYMRWGYYNNVTWVSMSQNKCHPEGPGPRDIASQRVTLFTFFSYEILDHGIWYYN